MTVKDLIAASSTIGDVLKMMPDVEGVDDEVIKIALATRRSGQRLGEKLVEMGAITPGQLSQALDLQSKLREAKNFDELEGFFNSVRQKEKDACQAFEFVTPRTGTD